MKKLLTVRGLQQHIQSPRGLVRAVDTVDLEVEEGHTLGLVGESGCGKSTLSRTIIGLMQATGGEIRFNDADITRISRSERVRVASEMQMVFQDPASSLNPNLSVRKLVAEPLDVHRRGSRSERQKVARALLEKVGLPQYVEDRYPHELSGGQRQRVGIARALALNPKLIICDEPVSALDVSVQAQVLNLLLDLQKENNYAYLFISHDLTVIRHISHRIAVMYLGRIVEIGNADAVWNKHSHPYTATLIASSTSEDVSESARMAKGELPSPINIPSGCRYRTRCPFAQKICEETEPVLRPIGDDHYAACHFAK